MHDAIKTYLADLNKQYSSGVAHEHSYRGPLQNLLAALLPKGYTIVNEPTREKCGAPDYIILKGNIPVAYIEAKDLQDNDLDGRREHREQFDRYKHSLDHIVFTDYLDFHLYEQGEYANAVRLAEVRGDKIVLCDSIADRFVQLIDCLAKATPQRITSPSRLATVMAGKARLLAGVIEQALVGDKEQTSELANQMRVFQEFLIHDLNEKTFADIYAQTIAYGLFSARLNDPTPDDFSRAEANELIPKSNPFLRRIFNDIAGYNVDNRIAWIVDDLVEVFRVTDMTKVMRGFGGTSGRTDPMMHFYEDFLGQYDPALRDKRGVYYTPQPVVDFIVRAVDDILKRDFNLPMGLADNSKIEHKIVNDWYHASKTKGDTKTISETIHRVQILDPATGTGTFLATAIRQIHANMEGQWGVWNDYVEQHLLPRLNGFELMMAPYTIAHLKLNMVLRETGYTASSDKRLRIYLTNSLEEHNAETGTIFAAAISQEASEASRIKRDTPVMVMMGNPPYSGSSQNWGAWIMQLMERYKKEPGGELPLQERNPKWLNDDYVKFIRLAQDYIEKNGEGIIGFINPHGYLDNPTFRGMRWNLLKTFDKIYTIDLHGNSKKKEVCPDGSKDENVFDIMQGVSINLFVKTGKKNKDELGKVYHKDLYGSRQSKYDFLDAETLDTAGYKEITPKAPMYFFVPKDFGLEETYMTGFKVDELFKLTLLGPNSHRDEFAICFTEIDAKKHIKDFKDRSISNDAIRDLYNLRDNRDWKLENARKTIPHDTEPVKCLYRPFDFRYMLYGDFAFDYLRPQLNDNLLRENIALVTTKQNRDNCAVFLTSLPLGQHKISDPYDGSYAMPLYLYQDSLEGEVRIPNLNSEIVLQVEDSLGETVEPQELFDYIYAVLHSPAYRTKFKEFLKIDFPRIPYPASKEEYHWLSAIGSQLRRLHLMEEVPPTKYAQFNTPGDNLVDKPAYKDGCVWINKEQCFADVPEEAWYFYIGGYQPAQKWLKDRRGRTLTYDDITHYQKIISILLETARLMKIIDEE